MNYRNKKFLIKGVSGRLIKNRDLNFESLIKVNFDLIKDLNL